MECAGQLALPFDPALRALVRQAGSPGELRFGAFAINRSEMKNKELVVGASGFEPETSCAQGRRATRLRYAPT